MPISLVCPFKAIWGIPCPGCGGTRTARALLNGNFLYALSINPLSCLIILLFIIMWIWSIWDGWKYKNTLYDVLAKQWSNRTLFIGTIIIVINWIFNIYKGL